MFAAMTHPALTCHVSECAVMRVASMSMAVHPVSVFPATSGQGNPAGVASMSSHARALAFARARAIRSRARSAPACSRARRAVGPLGPLPIRGQVCRSMATSDMLVAPSAIGAVVSTRTVPRSSAPGRFSLVNPEGSAAKRPSLRHLVTRTGRQGAGPWFTAMNRPRVLQAAGPAEWRRPAVAPAAGSCVSPGEDQAAEEHGDGGVAGEQAESAPGRQPAGRHAGEAGRPRGAE